MQGVSLPLEHSSTSSMRRSPPHFSSIILKLTAVCNLDCTYCYMFNLADRTFERVPKHMSEETATAAVSALARHARNAGTEGIKVVLHGGEPTLWPLSRFRALFGRITEERSDGLTVDVSLQTNGVLINPELLGLLMQHDVTLGFSLDGPQSVNDRARVTRGGAGTYELVVKNLRRVLSWGFPPAKIGVLSVVDPSTEPPEYMRWASGLPVRSLSLLWPIGHSWSRPPWHQGSEADYAHRPVYGSWMAAAFREWWERYLETLYVRQFMETIGRIMGSRHHSDSIGNDRVDMLVVNTDGGIEYPDYLRAHVDGGSRTSFMIGETDLERVTEDETFSILLSLRDHLPTSCRQCPHEGVCGGGFLAGRADAAGFDATRRSVLCYDQFHYFQSVKETIQPYLNVMNEFDLEHKECTAGIVR